MSFIRKLFGGGPSGGSSKPVEKLVYDGYEIATTPISEAGQFRVCAEISKEIDGEMKTHRLIRADMCSSKDDASETAMRKAKQMIAERGDRLFDI